MLGEEANGLYPVAWCADDAISVNGVKSSSIAIDSNASVATFSFDGVLNYPYCVAYPAANEGKVVFADQQSHTDGTFANGAAAMYGYAEAAGGIALKHLTGILKIGVTGDKTLTYAQISNANRAPIAGEFEINFADGEVTPTTSSKEVISYSFGDGVELSNEPTYIHVAVPAGVYGELYVTLYDTEGGVMYATVKAGDDKPLKAGSVREFSNSIAYVPNATLFVIRDKESLRAFAEVAPGSTQDALFVADVDMTGETWTPIESYLGTLNGNGYAIKGLTSPLFGKAYCSIKGLHLVDVNIEETADPAVGALARTLAAGGYKNGFIDVFPTVENCSVTGSVVLNNATTFVNTDYNEYGETVAAGLVGRAYGVTFRDCVNKARVEVKQCFPTGHTTSLYPSVGGIIGYLSYASHTASGTEVAIISNLYNLKNYGDISFAGTSYTGATNVSKYAPLKPYVGGLIGCSHAGNGECEMRNLTNYGNLTLTGVVGNGCSLSGTLGYVKTQKGSHFYNHGKLLVTDALLRYIYIGGGVGYCGDTTALDNVHNYGSVTVDETATCGSIVCGGLIGYQGSSFAAADAGHSIISNSSNSGPITVSSKGFDAALHDGTALYYRVGGLSGWTQHYYNNCNNLKSATVTCTGTVHNYGEVCVDETATCGSIVCGGLIGYQGSSFAAADAGHSIISNSSNSGPINVSCKGFDAALHDGTALYYRVGGLSGWTQHYYNNCNNLKSATVTCTGTVHNYDTSNYSVCVGGLVGYKTVNAIDNSRNDADVICHVDMTKGEDGTVKDKAYDGSVVRMNLGGICGYTNLPCRYVTNNGKVEYEGNLAGQLRIGGVYGQGNGVSTNIPLFDNDVNNGAVVIKKGSTIGHQLMIGGVAAFLGKSENCTNNGTVTIEDNVSWSGTYAYIGGAAGYASGTTTSLKNNGPLTIGKGCSMGTATHNYIGGALGQLYADKAEDLENTAKGVITIGESDYTGYVLLGGCMGTAPAVKTDGKTKLNESITNCRNYGAVNYYATHSKSLTHYIGGCLGYIYEVSVSGKLISPSTTDIFNYGPIRVESSNLYDVKVGGVSSFLGGLSNNIINYETGTIHVNSTTRRHIHFAGVSCAIKDTANDIYNYGDITIEGKVGHTLYGAGCITSNNNYSRTRNSNHGDITVNAEIATNNFVGGLVYDSGADLTYIDCHNTGNFILGEKAVVSSQTRWGGFVGKLEKSTAVTNTFDGCSNSGDIIIKGTASKTTYSAFGGIYGTATGPSVVIIRNGLVNSGDIIFEGSNEGTFVDNTTLAKRNIVELGGIFGHVASTIKFANEANPTWTGNVINTGTIKFAGKAASGVRAGGIAGYMQGNSPVFSEGQLINIGEVVVDGTFDQTLTDYNGAGGIAGRSEALIDNAVSYCSLKSANTPLGMITGSPRSATILATNCAVGGSIVGEYDTEDEAYKTTVLDASNYFNYIYGGGEATDWGTSENYDGCTLLESKPTVE